MRTRPAGTNRTKLLLATLAILVAFGYLTYRWMLARQVGPGAFALARTAYEKGLAADRSGDPATAAAQLDDAAKQADKAIASIEAKRLPAKAAEERSQLQGELFWLKARILRERAFLQAAQDGKPIAELLDSSTGETFRAFTSIPDPATRSNAISLVRSASERISDNAELTRDALRIELVLPPMQWDRIEKLCMMSLKNNPNDARALYFLAKYEFDQPGPDGDTGSLAYENRDAIRIARAKEYMNAARTAGAPYWRSVHLEAEILNWLSRDARKRDPVRANSYRDELRTLIMSQPNGAFEKAKRGENWTNLSNPDVRAIAAIPAIAAELALDDLVQLRAVARDALSIFDRLVKVASTGTNITDAGEGTIEVLVTVGPALVRHDPADWAAIMDEAATLFEKNPRALGRPKPALRFAKLYAQLPGANGATRAAEPRTRLLLGSAVAACVEMRTPFAKQVELRAAWIDALSLGDSPNAELLAQLAPLRALDDPLARAVVSFHDAVASQRAGTAQAARKKFEPLIDGKAAPELASRAMATLANIAFDAEDYNGGLGYLREVEAAFAKPDTDSPWDAAWLIRFAGSAREVSLRQVIAIYEMGRTRVSIWQRANPGKVPSDDMRAASEQLANPYARKLVPSSEADRLARQARIRFLAVARQTVLVEKQLAMLAADFPNHVEVLRLSAAVFSIPKPGETDPDAAAVARIDATLAEFLRSNPDSIGAKTFKLEWLLNTNRRSEALAYLRSPANFKPPADPLLDAAVSGTLFGTDGLDDVSTILAALPVEAGVPATIIAGSLPAVPESLAFRRAASERKRAVVAAWRQFFDGEFEPAAEGFLAAMDVAALKPTARAGLLRCLLQYADVEGDRAGAFLAKLQTRYPDEPSIFLAAALVALRNDDLGDPLDVWGNSKSMYAALNRWQSISHAYGVPAPIAAAMKTRFLLLAGRFEMAQQLTRQYSKSNPDEPALLSILCELHLDGPYRDLTAAKQDLAKAFAVVPDDAERFHRLEARVLAEGGDLDSARKVCELAVVNNPQSAAAFAQLIDVATARNDALGSMQAAFRWQREQPAKAQAITSLIVQLYRNSADSAAKPAADGFVRAASLRGKKHGVAARIAVAEGFFGNDDAETERWLREALEAEPADARGQALAGMLSERRKDWDAALQHEEAALKAKPHDFAIAARAMRILIAEKKNPEAAFAIGMKARTASEGNRLFASERLPAEFLLQWAAAASATRDRFRVEEARDGLLIGALHHPESPCLLVALAEMQNFLGEGARAAESLATALKVASDGTSRVSPQDRRDTLEKVEAARKKIRE